MSIPVRFRGKGHRPVDAIPELGSLVAIPGLTTYATDESGGLWTCRYKGGKSRTPLYLPLWKPMTPSPGSGGYPVVSIRVRPFGKSKAVKVATLVATAFHGPKPFHKAVCRHLDGDRNNSHPDNLIWGTIKENHEDMIAHGTRMIGEKNHQSKLTAAIVAKIRSDYSTGELLQRELAEKHGISQSCVSRVILRKAWKQS